MTEGAEWINKARLGLLLALLHAFYFVVTTVKLHILVRLILYLNNTVCRPVLHLHKNKTRLQVVPMVFRILILRVISFISYDCNCDCDYENSKR